MTPRNATCGASDAGANQLLNTVVATGALPTAEWVHAQSKCIWIGEVREINAANRRATLDSTMVETFKGKRSGSLLYRKRAPSRSSGTHSVSSAELARIGCSADSEFNWWSRDFSLLSQMSRAPLIEA